MKKPLLSIAVINYNTKELLEECFSLLQKITYPHYELFLIDQDSSDGSADFVEKQFPDVHVIRNKNTGYAGGANKAFDETHGEYLVIMNPDVEVTKDYFDILVDRCEKDNSIGAITGKILKPFPKGAKKKKGFKPMIDTTGLQAFRNRRVVDRGQGFVDTGQFEKTEEIFGISGCLALYRKEALDDIALPTRSKHAKHGEEVWDYDFFMYKEDVDVSWRLNLRGWKCIYEPKAVAYHARGTGVLKRYSNRDVLKHRKTVSPLARYHSYKNQRLMQVKNDTTPDILWNILTLLAREVLATGYVMLREPKTFLAFFEFLRKLPRALRKRSYIQSHRKVRSMGRFLKGNPAHAYKEWA